MEGICSDITKKVMSIFCFPHFVHDQPQVSQRRTHFHNIHCSDNFQERNILFFDMWPLYTPLYHPLAFVIILLKFVQVFFISIMFVSHPKELCIQGRCQQLTGTSSHAPWTLSGTTLFVGMLHVCICVWYN